MTLKKPTVPVKKDKKELESLIALASELTHEHYPPKESDNLVLLSKDLPIWGSDFEDVKAYQRLFKPAFDLAFKQYPEASTINSKSTLPAHLGLPHFFFNVKKIAVYKNKAKDSRSFGSVGAVLNCCGEFDLRDVHRLEDFFKNHPDGRLVCHREFVDLRARIYLFDNSKQKINNEYISTHFYSNGIIFAPHDVNDFQFVDNTKHVKKRIQRKDGYTDALATNETWKVYIGKGKSHNS